MSSVGSSRCSNFGSFSSAAVSSSAELVVERAQHADPVAARIRHAVEIALHLRGEARIDDVLEVLGQQIVDLNPDVGRMEAAFDLLDVPARLNRLDDRAVGRGPADPVLFEHAHERGFGEARRRLGEVLLGIDALEVERLIDRQLRQQRFLAVGKLLGGRRLRVVAAFFIHAGEAGEFQHASRWNGTYSGR